MSRPASRASFLARGEANTRPPDCAMGADTTDVGDGTGAARGAAAAAGAATGAGAGADAEEDTENDANALTNDVSSTVTISGCPTRTSPFPTSNRTNV